jgi:flagellar motor switch protein FliG
MGKDDRKDLARGLEAYQNTMKKQDEEDGGQNPPPETNTKKNMQDAIEGLLKTGRNFPLRPPAESPRAGFLRTHGLLKLPAVLPRAPDEAAGEDSKLRRVAKFLILIGGDEAAGILSQLDLQQVEDLSREIATIRGISGEEAAEIFTEFRSLLSSSYGYQGVSSGGVETARRLLYTAFGPQKGEEFLERALPETKDNPFGFLEDFAGEQIALLLKEETPAAEALILSRLSSKLSASVLMNTSPDKKMDIVRRIGRQGDIATEVLERMAGALREKARHFAEAGSNGNAEEVDGRNALTAILKSSDIGFGEKLLKELDDMDADLSEDLRDRLHSLDDVIKAEDRPLQEKLRNMTENNIVLLLKGRSDDFREKILANVSAQRRALIREEEEILGPVLRRDANKAAKEFLGWFREEREAGRILLSDDKDVVL